MLSDRPQLHGELCMTFGTPQYGPQSTCLPIGVGLSYDELTLLSCDVHRNAQHVRLFDIQTGRLKHTINSNQVGTFIFLEIPKTEREILLVANEVSSSRCSDE